VKIFSLPHLGELPSIELGFRGPVAEVEQAYIALCRQLDARGDSYESAAQPLSLAGDRFPAN